MGVTLEQLLASRDLRAQHQRDLLGKYPGRSLVCLTVQLPGPEKRNDTSLRIARAGVDAVRAAFSPEFEELKDLETGFEGYFLVPTAPQEAKLKACVVEDTHPLGRLMDLDVVFGPDGAILSRQDLNLAPRRCLLCDQPARYCMRAKTHSQAQLLERIEQMVKEYGI